MIRWHRQYPDDWKRAWFEIQKKWTDDIGCPGGVFAPFNIDATVNSAYVVLGLLYGGGDYGKTLEISARAGQDADCNPSSAAGILGVLLGYDAIPAYWKMGLKDVENMDFKYTTTSLNKVYALSYDQAVENIKRNGGKVENNIVYIKKQEPAPVKWEQSFAGIFPFEKRWLGKNLETEYEFEFTGNAFVIEGEYKPKNGSVYDENIAAVARVEMYIDGALSETIKLPMRFTKRRHEIAWKYQLENKKHSVKLKILNPDKASDCFLTQLILYSEAGKAPGGF